jgi:hypothetical protein
VPSKINRLKRTQPAFVRSRSTNEGKVSSVEMQGRALAPRFVDGLDENSARRERAQVLLATLRATDLRPAEVRPHPTDAPKAPEPSVEVGSYGFDATELQTALRCIALSRTVDDAEVFELDDDGVTDLVCDLLMNELKGSDLGPNSSLTPDAIALFRCVVRAAEKGEPVNIAAEVWSKRWPQDAATAALLHRAANAFDVRPADIPFGGETLASYLRPKQPFEAREMHRGPELDIARSLLNFYPSLQVAQMLAAEESLAAGVTAFVSRLSLPGDVRPLVQAAVGVEAPPESDEAKAPAGVERTYRDRNTSTPGEYQGFVVATGPLSTDGSGKFDYQTDAKGYFRLFATDQNLRSINLSLPDFEWSGFEEDWKNYPEYPVDIVSFNARRLELSSTVDESVKEELYGDALNVLYRTDACVPGLLRLAKAANADLDRILMSNGTTTLRQRAKTLGLRVEPQPKKALSAQIRAVCEGTPATRLATLKQLMSPDGPSVGEFIEGLLPSIEAGSVKPIAAGAKQVETLVSCLMAEEDPLTLAALASLFVRPASPALESLEERMLAKGFSDDDVETTMTLVPLLQKLPAPMKRWVLEPLAKNPPELADFEVAAAVASSAPFDTTKLLSLYKKWAEVNAGGALRAIVDIGHRTERSAEVAGFLAQGLEVGLLNEVDTQYALAGEAGAPLRAEAVTATKQSLAALAQADLVTRSAAVDAFVSTVRGYAAVTSSTELICHALVELYERDLDTVMALSEIESTSLHGSAFTDWRPVRARIGSKSDFTFEALIREQPALAHQVEMLKSRVELQHLGAEASELADAAETAGQQWLARTPSVDAAYAAAVLDHLSRWALNR